MWHRYFSCYTARPSKAGRGGQKSSSIGPRTTAQIRPESTERGQGPATLRKRAHSGSQGQTGREARGISISEKNPFLGTANQDLICGGGLLVKLRFISLFCLLALANMEEASVHKKHLASVCGEPNSLLPHMIVGNFSLARFWRSTKGVGRGEHSFSLLRRDTSKPRTTCHRVHMWDNCARRETVYLVPVQPIRRESIAKHKKYTAGNQNEEGFQAVMRERRNQK